MSRFLSISILLLAISHMAAAQQRNTSADDDTDKPLPPKIIVDKDQGLSLGIDLSPFIMRIFEEERTGLCFVGRYGLGRSWYAAAELGYENTQYDNADFSYKSNGTFLRIGADLDIFNSEDFPMNDNVFVGLRYCYSWQSHESDHFRIVDSYWGNYEGSISNSSVNSHSADALFGVRCEVLRNLYMGWTFRCRFLLASKHDKQLDPYAVAGYGKYDSKVAMGFTYTIEYQIPFNKFGKR